MTFFISPTRLNYLEFLCGSGMFKKTHVEILMKVRRGAPGASGKMNQKLVENLGTSSHMHSQSPLLPSTLYTVCCLPLGLPQQCQNKIFLIFPLVWWSVVLPPRLPSSLPSFLFYHHHQLLVSTRNPFTLTWELSSPPEFIFHLKMVPALF